MSSQIDNVSQQLLFQALTQYFAGPNPHPLPYTETFKNSVNVLKYLYPYLSSQYNKVKLKEPLIHLVSNIELVYKQIINQSKQQRKILLTRLISLNTVISNFNAGSDLVPKIQQNYLIMLSITLLGTLNEDEQIFLANKIILLGYHRILCQNQYILNLIIQKFIYLSKQYKLIMHFLINESQYQQSLNRILSMYVDCIAGFIGTLINSLEFKQTHSKILFKYFSKIPQLKNCLINNLLNWWSKGNDSLTTKINSQFKTNLLGLFVQSLTKQQILQNNISYFLSQGITKRIPSNQYKRSAIIIWVRMAKRLNLEDTVKDFIGMQALFEDELFIVEVNNNQNIQNAQKKKSLILIEQKKNISSSDEGQNQQQNQIIIKAPKNIYDCILGIQNPKRKKVTLKYLPTIMTKYPDDLTLCWLQLIRVLLIPLHDSHKESLIVIFTLKPLEVIDVISDRFFKSDCSMQQRIIIVTVIKQAIQELSSNPQKYSNQIQNNDKDFYFKKIRSTYYNDKQPSSTHQPNEKQGRVRRWGHTRIAHQNKNKSQSLLVLNNQPYINRLYQIVNSIFFKMISKFTNSSINLLKNQQFTKCLLLMMCTFVENIKNHLEKYSIITEVIVFTLRVLQSYQNKKTDNLMVIIQLYLKVSICIDYFINQSVLLLLKKSLEILKKRQQYGIKPFIEAIQENIYINIKRTKSF